MSVLADELRSLRSKFEAQIDLECARLEQERKFLESVLEKSLGGAVTKDKAAKEADAVSKVRGLLGLG